jgi:O-antigen ligase
LLGRNVDRPLEEKLAAGARPALWRELITAIPNAPLWGHGWQQIGAAQQSVALDRPPVPAFFEHFDAAHNIVLDLVLWAGIPIGGLIALLCALALWAQLRRLAGSGGHAADARAVWLMAGVLGLLAHGLLEFPLSFAYFLVPLGVSLGMIHAWVPARSAPLLPRGSIPAAGAVLAALLMVVGFEYLQAEENFRLARLETARIGTDRVSLHSPNLRVLTQLDALLRFVRTEVKPDMATEDLDRMRKVALRYGFSSTLFRYATALGLNGQPREAARTLQLLCHIHSRKRCREAREAWPAMQQRYEVLRAVPPP